MSWVQAKMAKWEESRESERGPGNQLTVSFRYLLVDLSCVRQIASAG